MGHIATSYGGTVIELWMPPKALQECNTTTASVKAGANHSTLFNAMIHPFTRMVIHGATWYQVPALESNCMVFRYLWREPPCPFKQAALYSSTDANLPTFPYIKDF